MRARFVEFREIAGNDSPDSALLGQLDSHFGPDDILLCASAGLDPGFDIGGAALDLYITREKWQFYKDAAKTATHLRNKGYVTLAKAAHPWPCALVENFGWVRDNLFEM